MQTFPLKFGDQIVYLPLHRAQAISTILPGSSVSETTDGQEIIRSALEHPLTDLQIKKLSTARKIAIAVNDKTRPVPYASMVPPLLAFIKKHNPVHPQITWIAATGTHKPLLPAELEQVLSYQLREGQPFISHDCDDQNNLANLGKTNSGTPVSINRVFMEADYRIVLGNIEPHHFMGYSGGAKTVAIGLAGRETIRKNHAMLVSPLATTACYEQNPCRQDVEEISRLLSIELCLNVIADYQKTIQAAYCGDPHQVIQSGIQVARKISQVKVEKKFDLVFVSAGGYPKDINLYQAHKAISNAVMLTKEGGHVILFAECRDGHGSLPYYEFMQGLTTPDLVLEKFTRLGFEIGPHKAFLIARQLKRMQLSIVSTLPDQLVSSLLLNPLSSWEALQVIQQAIDTGKEIACMPYGVSTVPNFEGKDA